MNTKDNNPLNFLIHALEWVVDAIARSLVTLFDGAKDAIDHANPSLFALIATLLPFILPLPVAFMSSASAQRFFHWESWSANVLGLGLEGLGLLAWTKLVDVILASIQEKKWGWLVVLYGAVAVVYELLLLFLNAVLAAQEGATTDYVVVLASICLLPALSALLFGHHKHQVVQQLAREKAEAKADAERIRQEKRDERREARMLKMQGQQSTATYAEDTDAPFRSKQGRRPRKQ